MNLSRISLVLVNLALIFSCSSKSVPLSSDDSGFLYGLFDSPLKPETQFHIRVLKTASQNDSYRLQNLRAILGGLNSIIKISDDDYFIRRQVSLIDDIISSAKVSSKIPENVSPFKDDYKGWVSLDRSRSYGEEIVLNEAYSFFYIAEFLHYQLKSGWVDRSRSNKTWWEEKVQFVEEHIWVKWYTRSLSYHGNPHRYFLRSRVHMASHWAGIAMYLERISDNIEIQKQCEELYQTYDMLLKRNLKHHPVEIGAYIWNSTYDNVSNTFAIKADKSIIQDVSHGNHVVSYIVAAYELESLNWQHRDILGLCNTVKMLYNKVENRFADNVDGSESTSRRGWGNFQADGWVKLSHYDDEVRQIFDSFSNDIKVLNRYSQYFQFRSNFLRER